MNLFISADDKYITPAKIMLTSFMINNPQESHDVYFIYHSVHEKNLKELETLVNRYAARFIPIHIQEAHFDGFKHSARFPINVYFRFLIPYYLAKTEDRALWLDVDLVVTESLTDFYHQDFAGNYLIACCDIGAQERPALLGCPAGTVYVNSGVLLINATAMRQIPLSDYRQYYLKYEDVILWPDQDILNGLFAPRIKVLDNNLFNCQITRSFNFKQYDFITMKKIPPIVHYVGAPKPWHLKYYLPAGDLWDYYHLIAFDKPPVYSFFYRTSRRFLRYCNRSLHSFVHAARRWHNK